MNSPVKVKIKNFQSIEEVDFVIDGFTIITGKTNIGKSSLIRAISSSILNSPVVNMVRSGEKFCTVELSSDGWAFKWEKGEKGTNRYYINGSDKPLDSVGRGQIDEIKSMGFQSVKIGNDKYLTPWYANQYESVFLLNQSGPSVTDFISEVSRLDVLQNAIVYSNREKKRIVDKTKHTEDDLSKMKDRREKFARLDEIRGVRDELALQKDSIVEYQAKVSRLSQLDNDLSRTASHIRKINSVETISIPVPVEKEDLNRLRELSDLNLSMEKKAKSIISMKPVADISLPDPPDSALIRKIVELNNLAKKITALQSSIEKLETGVSVPELEVFPEALKVGFKLLSQIEKVQNEIQRFEKQESELSSKLSSLESELAKIPKCPTCDRPLSPAHKNHSDSGTDSFGI